MMKLWFSRKLDRRRPTVKTHIGAFEFDGDDWTAVSHAYGEVYVRSTGHKIDIDAVRRAEAVLESLEEHCATALNYIADNGATAWDSEGQLSVESIDITEILNDEFGLTFGVSDNAGYTLTVEFREGVPCEVWGAD